MAAATVMAAPQSSGKAAGFYLVAPDTGSSKTLAWDWAGTGTSADPAHNFAITFWKGVHQTTPVRDSDSTTPSGSFPFTTPTLTAQSATRSSRTSAASTLHRTVALRSRHGRTPQACLSRPPPPTRAIARERRSDRQSDGRDFDGHGLHGRRARRHRAATGRRAAASSLLWTPSRSFQHMLIR
jgi:hypothetical protein